MFKKTTGFIIALILVISLLSGCSKDSNPVGPSDNPAPGFEISNLSHKVSKSGSTQRPDAGANFITVDYIGAEGGIKEIIASINDRWDALPVVSGGQGSSGTVSSGGYGKSVRSGNGTYTLYVYLKGNSGRNSNTLSSTFTVDFL